MYRNLTVVILLVFQLSTYSQNFYKNDGQIIDQYGIPNNKVLFFLPLNRQNFNVQLKYSGFSYDLFQNINDNEFFLVNYARIDFELINSNKKFQILPLQKSRNYFNYYTSGTPVEGVKNIYLYKTVIYKNIYKNIDLEFLIDSSYRFKYNFILYPGSSVSSILIKISGPDTIELENGSLFFRTSLGTINEIIPNCYYQINRKKFSVRAHFIRKGIGLFGIELNSIIPRGAKLILDPVPIRDWGTYYGGNSMDDNGICDIDEDNNVYLAGHTYSTNNIATAGAFQGSYQGSGDAFLAKFKSDGSQVWGTYYGGANTDQINSLHIKAGKIVFTGITTSPTNIATPGAYQTSLASLNGDAMLVQFDTAGNRLWGTYYGGAGQDQGNSCFIDNNENIYFAGFTSSTAGISTPGSHQPTYGGGMNDAFLAKFTSSGSLVWATYYGGNGNDNSGGPTSCIVDNNMVYLCGLTTSANNISTPGSFQPNLNGTGATTDGYIASFTTNGVRQWGTYFGGSDNDAVGSIAVMQDHSVILTGSTSSAGIATPGSYQTIPGGGKDAFLTKFLPDGQNVWSTYYGGLLDDIGNCVITDPANNIFLAGQTMSLNGISTPGSYQVNYSGGTYDGMLVKFDLNGSLLWGTYFGSDNMDQIWTCSFASPNILYFAGYTSSSTGISTTGSHQPIFGGGGFDNFLEKFNVCPVPEQAGAITGPNSICYPSSGINYSIPLVNNAISYHWSLPLGASIISGANTNSITLDFSSLSLSGIISVYGVNGCGIGDSSFMAVTLVPADSVNIMIITSQNNICSGTSVTFTAVPTNPGTTPVYQWKVNGSNVGGNSSVFTYTPVNGDQVQCILTSSITVCISNNPASSNILSMVVNPLLPVSVSVSASANNVCAGTAVTFTAAAVNGGLTPVYQWKVNGIPAGTNSQVYTYTPLNNDAITCTLTSSEACISGNPSTSSALIMTVNPLLPVGVSISASSNPFCLGTSVTLTATPANGGPLVVYQWKINGINAGTNSPTYTYNPVSGDVVTCLMNSSLQCVSGNPATSNAITLTGIPGLPASVSITANPNPFCPGSSVTFTAIPGNGGANPSYQWKVNGVNAGTNSPTFTYNPLNNDSVRCVMTSTLSCISANPATSNKITLSGTLAPVITFTSCFDTVTTVNAKPINLKGGIPLNGIYSGPGVSAGIFNPAVAGIGTKSITYTYTNVFLCSASKTRTITVQVSAPFTCGNTLTDIRDGKTYPSVQIGTQCWMAANLNRGTQITSAQVQFDNCVDEKYCFGNDAAKCSKYGGLYQWDEMMRYDDVPEGQGLCPPGWHIPTDNDWTVLCNFYNGYGFAGKPLQDTIISGFRALPGGIFYLNSSWSFADFAVLFWTSSSWGSYKALSHGMNTINFSVSLYPSSRANAFPVRCLRD